MTRTRYAFAVELLAVLLAGCATAFDIRGADTTLTPQQAITNIAGAGTRAVAWGGTIVNARNFADHTQLEILAYPLDKQNRPDRDAQPLGRFLAMHSGYLETADFKEGRLVTVVGRVTGSRAGQVGDAWYIYPLLGVERMHLWPQSESGRESRVHFGIGVGITR